MAEVHVQVEKSPDSPYDPEDTINTTVNSIDVSLPNDTVASPAPHTNGVSNGKTNGSTANDVHHQKKYKPGELASAESHSTVDGGGAVTLRECEADVNHPPNTVHGLFHRIQKEYPDNIALAIKRNGEWVKWTYKQYWEQSRAAAKSFLKLGLQRFHGVGIIGFNSPEWFLSNMGAMFAGGFGVGIYTTNSPEACQYVAGNCKASVVVVENSKQLQKILKVWDQLPHLKAVVQYTGTLEEKRENVYEWEEFMKLGSYITDDELDNIMQSQAPNQCCALIYTSGTTGNPKGVMISHDNYTWISKRCLSQVNIPMSSHRVVSYLPLSHVAAQVFDIYFPLYLAGTTYFAQPDALRGESTSVILGPDPAPNPKYQMRAQRNQGHLQKKGEISTKHSALKKIPDSNASVLGYRKGRKDQDTRHHKEENDDTQNGRNNRQPAILDPDSTGAKRYKSATGDQGRVEGKAPAENEDISHAISYDSDTANLGSVRPLELSQKDCNSRERPKEEGEVDVTDKNDGDQRMYSKPDPELSCSSHGKKQAKRDPILQGPSKRKTLIKTGYSGVQIFRFPLFFIALFFSLSVMSVLGNMNPVWYKEGDNAVIHFPCEGYDSESTQMILKVRMQSMLKPFYANGIIEHDGFKDDSQIERFNVSKDGEGLKLEITHVQREDEDVFIFTQIFFQDNSETEGDSKYFQLKLLTPAQCDVVSGSSLIVVYCRVASPGAALFCFRGTFSYRPDNIGTDDTVAISFENNVEQIVCCTAARNGRASISARPENCRDFTWSPTSPALSPTPPRRGQNGIDISTTSTVPKHNGGNPSYEYVETVPPTPSSGSRLRYLRTLITTITGTGLVLSWLIFV